MPNRAKQYQIELLSVVEEPLEDAERVVQLQTDKGSIDCRLHPGNSHNQAVVWVGGAGGRLDGPAGGMYPRLARQLAKKGIESLRLDYRFPNHLTDCVLDTLVGVTYLEMRERQRVVLVGHSFGGAVVINAGVLSPIVAGVAALSSQTAGTNLAPDLAPRPLLLIHGVEDEVLPHVCSRDIYQRAHEPKDIRLYPGCNHGLDACRDDVDRDLMVWIESTLTNGKSVT